jgi:hypothetical protein
VYLLPSTSLVINPLIVFSISEDINTDNTPTITVKTNTEKPLSNSLKITIQGKIEVTNEKTKIIVFNKRLFST